MKNFFWIIFCLLSQIIFSQNEISVSLQDSIHFEADTLLATDTYGYYYFLKENSLIKTNFSKKLEYQNTSLGKPTYLDAQNPLQLVVFYKNFNSIILLDNQLNEIIRIDGNTHGLVFEAVGLARQNKLWFYDSVSQKFGLFNLKDSQFSFISTFYSTKFVSVYSNYNSFYWVDQTNQLNSISFYGKFSTPKKLTPFDVASIKNEDEYLIFSKNEIYYYKNDLPYKVNLLRNSSVNFCFKNGILSTFTDNSVINYKLNLP